MHKTAGQRAAGAPLSRQQCRCFGNEGQRERRTGRPPEDHEKHLVLLSLMALAYGPLWVLDFLLWFLICIWDLWGSFCSNMLLTPSCTCLLQQMCSPDVPGTQILVHVDSSRGRGRWSKASNVPRACPGAGFNLLFSCCHWSRLEGSALTRERLSPAVFVRSETWPMHWSPLSYAGASVAGLRYHTGWQDSGWASCNSFLIPTPNKFWVSFQWVNYAWNWN